MAWRMPPGHSDADAARTQCRAVADQLRRRVPKLAARMAGAEVDVLAFATFPRARPAKIHSSTAEGLPRSRSSAPLLPWHCDHSADPAVFESTQPASRPDRPATCPLDGIAVSALLIATAAPDSRIVRARPRRRIRRSWDEGGTTDADTDGAPAQNAVLALLDWLPAGNVA
jgi:hypothetical protein